MKTAGMIGGLGPESTIDYYRSILARYRARKPDSGYPHILINSLDVDKGLAMLDAGRLDELADYLAVGVAVAGERRCGLCVYRCEHAASRIRRGPAAIGDSAAQHREGDG